MFFKEWFESKRVSEEKEKPKNPEKYVRELREEYNRLCHKVSSYPKAKAKMEKEFESLRKRQRAMSEELSRPEYRDLAH